MIRNSLVALLIGVLLFSCDDKPFDYAAAKREDNAALQALIENNTYGITEDNFVDGIYFLEQVAGDPDGLKPTVGRNISVNYTGKFLDGTVFEEGEDISFTFGSLIQGMNIGIGKLTKGAKAVLVIPYELAYGTYGGGNIPPCTSLIFEVELLSVQ